MNISSIGSPAAHISAPVEPASTRTTNESQRVLIRAVQAVNAVEAFGRDNEITFIVDPRTRQAVLRIVDRETGEMVGQIPAEEVLRMAEKLERK
jgi:flagellar protein FlaG